MSNNANTDFIINNSKINDSDLISEKFNEFFVNIGKNLSDKISCSKSSFYDYMPKQYQRNNSCALFLTTPIEILQIIKSLKDSESVGIDEIPIKIIKSVAAVIMEPLSKIINCCLVTGIFPDKLKIARVCPIYKSGDKSDLSNYRPVSVLNGFSKIFEKIIYARITDYVCKNEIINPSQFGFRSGHSTYMALLNLYDKVSEAIDNNEYCIGVFIDLSKAFDTIKHDILLKKLELYGIRGIANDLIKNYLFNRQQFVRFNNSQSSLKNAYCGVPQGSILGPLLFLLYINDITYCCKYLKFILFADDTNLLYSNPDFNQLINITNSELDILSDWFRANMLSLNVAKTNYMLFGFKKMQFSNNSNITN